MKISYNWLKKYINIEVDIDKVSEVLTDIGLEVEGLEKLESIKGGLEGIVVGEVLTCEKHPDADKLSITTVDYGDGIKTIVCGAPNVAAGEKVIVATVGCTLYPSSGEEFKIKKSKIRGVESLGMLCAEDELGIGQSHDGIILLDKSFEIGTPAKNVFKLEEDYILEIGLTPNRIDAASHYGVARDLAAVLKYQGYSPELNCPEVSQFSIDNTSSTIPVEVIATDRSPRYLGVTISDITIAPSPEWLQTNLRAIGINPKNNVVDITNYILHELGQPLHAFDLDKIEGGKVIVRTANEGEKFITLDGLERELSKEDLVICDTVKPMCIAGVMGGEFSGVSETTKSIFLESAYFNAVSVRKTSKRHTISSDASFRYERGTDPNIVEYAIKRAALLIKEISGGTISSEIIEVTSEQFPPFEIQLSINKTHNLIGKEIGKDTIIKILNSLDIEITSDNNADLLSLKVPQYRVDVQRDVDIVEEIMRIYGLNNIEIPLAVKSTISYAPKPDIDRVTNKISDFFTSNGFHEIMSNSLTRATYYEELKSFPIDKSVKIANPLSQDLNVMRQTLLFSALEAVELNTNRRNSNLKLYEFGNCYFYNPYESEDILAPYSEQNTLGILVTGSDMSASWNVAQKDASIFTLKSYIERMLKSFGLDINKSQLAACESDIYSDAMSVKFKNKHLMNYGIVAKSITKNFGIKNNVYYAEINFDNLLHIVKNYKLTVEQLSKYPEVRRDLALLVDKSVLFIDLYNTAFKSEKKLLKNVSLFDVYEGDKLPEGKKSYALNFVLEDTTKTLTDNVIDKCMNNMIFQFEKQHNTEIRK